MKETIVVDLSRLHSDTKNLKFKKKFGSNKYIFRNNGNITSSISFVKVVDEPEPFINLFGLSVGTETGNIALGLFPNPNSYILLGNFFKIFAKRVFNGNLPEYIDKKLLLELLKVNPVLFLHNLNSNLNSMYLDFRNSGVQKSNSIIMELVRKFESVKESKTVVKSIGVDVENVFSFVYECVNKFLDCQKLAVEYFGAFISELTSDEVLSTLSKYSNTSDLLESSVPNLNSRYLKFLDYKIDTDFLLALSSFGIGIKQRRSILNVLDSITVSEQGFEYVFYASVLGSFSYMDYSLCDKSSDVLKQDYDKIICYNIIDMIHAIGWENAFMYSLDIIKEFKNYSAYLKLKDKYHLCDFWLENKIDESLFVKTLNFYNLNILPKIDCGSMYTREVKFSQYGLPVFSTKQMINSGRVFSEVGNLVLKKF